MAVTRHIGGRNVEWVSVEEFGRSLKSLPSGSLLKIDRAFALDGFICIEGWCSEALKFHINDACLLKKYERSDINGRIADNVCGFLLIAASGPDTTSDQLYISDGAAHFVTEVRFDFNHSDAEQMLVEQLPRIDLIFPIVISSWRWRVLMVGLASTECDPRVKCAVDGAAIAGDRGLVAMGWAFGPSDTSYWLLTGSEWRLLDHAIGVKRPDIMEAYRDDAHLPRGPVGFYATLRGEFTEGDEVALLAVGPGMICIAGRRAALLRHEDPIELSKLLFSIETPLKDFTRRLEHNEGPALSTLLERKSSTWSDDCLMDLRLGESREEAKTSVIVPLYGRWDFVEHQLAAFSHDPEFTNDIELVYVIDDPELVDPLERAAPFLHQLYGVPFRIIWSGENRGFSGANNFGAANAAGRVLIFLNSDVFPSRGGWVGQLRDLLNANEDYGIIAPRLLYPDGTIQHAGMAFEYHAPLSIWVNKHPMAGLPPRVDKTEGLAERPAVTGACMAMRSEDFWEVDGFDTGYLIGDFEDSDLCLKIRATGKRIGYTPDVTLTHLERQSFGSIGEGGYRQRVVIFNAWRHFNRWGKAIVELSSEPADRAA